MYIVLSKEEAKFLTKESVEELQTKLEELAIPYINKDKEASKNREKPLIDRRARSKTGKIIKRKYNVDFDYFYNVNNENSYWAGFLAADGHVSTKGTVNLSVARKDQKHLELFKDTVKFEGPLGMYNTVLPSGNTYYRTKFCSTIKGWQEDLLNNFNIQSGAKSLTLEPPKDLTLEQSLSYIKGMIDGDGSITNKDGVFRIEIILTLSLGEWVKDIINNLTADLKRNDCNSIHKANCKAPMYIYQVGGPQALKLASIIRELNLPGLDRKWSQIPLESNF